MGRRHARGTVSAFSKFISDSRGATMKTVSFWAMFFILTLLASGLVLSGCSCGDDDDDASSVDDDDNINDDDDDAADDDTADDDTADDDTTDDDTTDDDTADDDTTDDDTTDDDTGDDDTGDDDTTIVWSDDFDAYSVGNPPPEPCEVKVGGIAVVEVVALDKAVNQGLLTQSTAYGDYYHVKYMHDTAILDRGGVIFDADILSGSSVVFFLHAEVSDLALVHYFLGELAAQDDDGNLITCVATVNYGVWHTIDIRADIDNHSYDVIFDGNSTPCTDITFTMDGAFPLTEIQGFSVYNVDSWNGAAKVDNIRLYSIP